MQHKAPAKVNTTGVQRQESLGSRLGKGLQRSCDLSGDDKDGVAEGQGSRSCSPGVSKAGAAATTTVSVLRSLRLCLQTTEEQLLAGVQSQMLDQ